MTTPSVRRLPAAVLIAIRGALRNLRGAPLLASLIVGMLGSGIAVATAMFSVVDALLVRAVPGVSDPGRVRSIERTGAAGVIDIFSYPDYTDLRDRLGSDVALAAFTRTSFDVRSDASRRVSGALVSDNYFAVLGVPARLGRTLTHADSGTNVAVISEAGWRELFGSDRNIVGRMLRVNGHAVTVVGVLPSPFSGTYPGQPDTVWLPYSAQPLVMPRLSAGVLANRNSRWVQIVGRLNAGEPVARLDAHLAAAGQALAVAFPGDHASGRLVSRPGVGLATDDRAAVEHLLGLLSAAGLVLLLIACGNASNLLLTRGYDRRREMTIRRALGATERRIALDLLAEGMVLAAAAAAAGLALTPRAIGWIATMSAPVAASRPAAFGVEWRACVFAIATGALVSVIFTLLPLHATRGDAATALTIEPRGMSRRRTRVRSVLLATQVALSVMLAAGAMLSLETMRTIGAITPGYVTSGAVLASYALDLHDYTPARAATYFSSLAAEVRSQPGVSSVSWATAVPPAAYGGRRSVFRMGEAPPQAQLQQHEETLGVRAELTVVGPGFFPVMGIALERGRGFDAGDRAGSPPVAIVSRGLAARLWPGEDAVGRFLDAPPYSGAVPPPLKVIGVAADTRHRSLLGGTDAPVLYLPFLQQPDTRATLIVRAAGDAGLVAPLVRRAAERLDADVPELTLQTIEDYDAATLAEQHAMTAAFTLFGACGLMLAAIGVYAALAHDVTTRRRELAVRVALGASAARVARVVIGDALGVSATGAAAGVMLSLAASGRLQGFLFGVSARDPLTFVAAPASLLVLAIAAAAIPARRAAGADPLDALRE